MQELMIFEGHEVEVFELNGQILFNPYHVGECLSIGNSAVKMAVSRMNEKQVIKLTNPKVNNIDFRKLHNTGENFLTESGVYKLVFKSRKPNAEKFTDWIADEVLPVLRKTGSYEMPNKAKPKKQSLASVNTAAKLLRETLSDAGVDKKDIAVAVSNLYKTEAGIDIELPSPPDELLEEAWHNRSNLAKLAMVIDYESEKRGIDWTVLIEVLCMHIKAQMVLEGKIKR